MHFMKSTLLYQTRILDIHRSISIEIYRNIFQEPGCQNRSLQLYFAYNDVNLKKYSKTIF